MVDDVVNVFHQDLTDVREIHQHPFVGHARYINDIAFNFGFKTVPVAVQMLAFDLLIWHTMSSIRFHISSNAVVMSSPPLTKN